MFGLLLQNGFFCSIFCTTRLQSKCFSSRNISPAYRKCDRSLDYKIICTYTEVYDTYYIMLIRVSWHRHLFSRPDRRMAIFKIVSVERCFSDFRSILKPCVSGIDLPRILCDLAFKLSFLCRSFFPCWNRIEKPLPKIVIYGYLAFQVRTALYSST